MPISSHLLRKLQEALGAEAAEDLVNSIERSESLRGDVAELRHEMQLGFARLESMIERKTGDQIKWSFVFWVTAVLSIAAVAGVLK